MLVAEWLLERPAPALAATLHPYRGLFYPTVFDSLRIRQLKLYPPQRVPHLPQSEGEEVGTGWEGKGPTVAHAITRARSAIVCGGSLNGWCAPSLGVGR